MLQRAEVGVEGLSPEKCFLWSRRVNIETHAAVLSLLTFGAKAMVR